MTINRGACVPGGPGGHARLPLQLQVAAGGGQGPGQGARHDGEGGEGPRLDHALGPLQLPRAEGDGAARAQAARQGHPALRGLAAGAR